MGNQVLGQPQSVECRHDPDGHLGTTVVSAVSDATGIPVTEMGTELNETIDPDALDALFANRYDGTARDGGTLTFSLHDCEVRVHGDGRVAVTPE